ncbi:flagellar biosynthetic protein FlhB [Noviherbaspirillum humi]|uniref:Flagellar biosynthetic protein FlhB n=1 Tax=Noviherbaspirillum humi TaxID=1688639 RepID=A0A239FVQ5_9BURK|nr:flagellar biosynthesis protein FlhB [Noviherbaspirillum humi]SNS60618.1 flagellar biosynthetic protein FlhB [Noviherbaspirillum humi]
MAEDSDLEKTESASPRRLEQARQSGDVPRSRELGTCTLLLAAGAGLWMSGDGIMNAMSRLLADGMAFERARAFDMDLLLVRLADRLIDVLMAFAPLAGLLLLVAIASPLVIGGLVFSTEALAPNFNRLNPLSGLGNLVSTHSAVELLKAIAKALLVAVVAWLVISRQFDVMMALGLEPLQRGGAHMAGLLFKDFMIMAACLAFIAAIDVPFQLWQYNNKLKMTKEEVKQEAKESEGDPHIKAKIRAMQRQMARRRMMAEVPKADVVVTNPTHFAVALKYSEGAMRAPKVVAKGTDEVAAKIRELAAESGVPLLEAPPLARALHKHTELGDEIPSSLYTAVAEVLAYVFQLRAYKQHGGLQPQAPVDLEVPAAMDPFNPASRTDTGSMQ